MKELRRRVIFVLVLFLLFCLNLGHAKFVYEYEAKPISASEYVDIFSKFVDNKTLFDYVVNLCKDEFQGRLSGGEGERGAAEYIKDNFENFGLTPLLKDGYYQYFTLPYYQITKVSDIVFEFKDKILTLELRKDFIPINGNGKVNSECVFAGFGIVDRENGYDDYKSLDVRNKVVIIFRGAPKYINVDKNTLYLSSKVYNAYKKGAIGVIIIDYPDT